MGVTTLDWMAWEGIRGGDSKEEPIRGEVGVGLANQGGQGLALEQREEPV